MPVDETLAQLSNNLVYSAIAVYVVAMVAFFGEFAVSRRITPADESAAASAAVPAAAPAGRIATSAAVSAAAPAGGRTATRSGGPRPSAGLGAGERLGRVGVALTVLAVGLHAAGVVTRGLAAGRAPFGNMYEFSVAAALAVTLVWLALMRRWELRFLGVVVVPAVLLTLGLAVTVLYTEAAELVPNLNSYWKWIHVGSAIVSAGFFTVGALLSALLLLRDRAERRAGGSVAARGWAARLPSARRLDAHAGTVHAFVFPLWTFAVVSGAIWAESAWGRYWGWDPKETWAFITWVVYAAYLHARVTAGWKGRSAAGIALVGYATFLINYYGVNFLFSGLHSYAGVG